MTFEPAERWFHTAAGRMNYAEGGSGERPVVLIHGVTLRWQSMTEIITELAESARTCTPVICAATDGRTGRTPVTG